jgi:hypothetical protein
VVELIHLQANKQGKDCQQTPEGKGYKKELFHSAMKLSMDGHAKCFIWGF